MTSDTSSRARTRRRSLFTLLAERYEQRSVFITSNLIFAHWDRIFRDQMATAAAIDRLVHHSVLLEFDVPSFRTEQATRRGKAHASSRQPSQHHESGACSGSCTTHVQSSRVLLWAPPRLSALQR